MSNISIIIQREFNERVRKKSFIITTLLMPVLMIGLMAAPALIMQFSRGDEKVIAVIDDSGLVAPKLENDEEIRFETTELPTEEARKQLTEKFGVLYIGGDILKNPNNVRLSLESNITGQIERILEAEKLKAYNIENLSQILDEVKTSVNMQTFRNDKSQEEDTQAQSSAVATGVGYVLGFILYMFLLIYGSMVMQSVIEEKNNRVLEVMVSSVRMPITLPIILALLMMFVVIKDPNSQLAFWFSIIPFTSPIVMMARIPYDIPLWEVALSLVVLYASFVGMVWFAAKIYRVGIFMYGKKPSLKELFKWIRYKY